MPEKTFNSRSLKKFKKDDLMILIREIEIVNRELIKRMDTIKTILEKGEVNEKRKQKIIEDVIEKPYNKQFQLLGQEY